MNILETGSVGLHIRITDSLITAADKALRLQLPFFQCFFVHQETGALMSLSDQEKTEFIDVYRSHFSHLYLHGSYWINLAGITYNGYSAFRSELEMAKRLSFTHMVVHAGSAKGAQHKQQGIDALARILNRILKRENDVQIMLENTAHKNMTIGSDIADFGILLEQLNYPEKVGFALDTAHAFVYGYDINTQAGCDSFVQLVDDTIGLERVMLLHINDASQPCGSCIDKHAVLGEGLINSEMLKRIVTHPRLSTVPIILELPVLPEDQEHGLVRLVNEWRSERQ